MAVLLNNNNSIVIRYACKLIEILNFDASMFTTKSIAKLFYVVFRPNIPLIESITLPIDP